jgi:hypothetical protein
MILPNSTLFERICWSKENLKPVQPEFAIVWETPMVDEETCKITSASPEFMAKALHGGILPDIEAYIEDRKITDAWEAKHGSQKGFNWNDHGCNHAHTNSRQSAMTQEETIDYLIKMVLPTEVQNLKGNRPYYQVTKRSNVLRNRLHRNSWKMAYDFDNPLSPDFDKAKAIQKKALVDYFIGKDKRAKEIEPYVKFDAELEKELVTIKGSRPDVVFDRLERSKTIAELNNALPAALIQQFFMEEELAA